jgi:hypothetical protein
LRAGLSRPYLLGVCRGALLPLLGTTTRVPQSWTCSAFVASSLSASPGVHSWKRGSRSRRAVRPTVGAEAFRTDLSGLTNAGVTRELFSPPRRALLSRRLLTRALPRWQLSSRFVSSPRRQPTTPLRAVPELAARSPSGSRVSAEGVIGHPLLGAPPKGGTIALSHPIGAGPEDRNPQRGGRATARATSSPVPSVSTTTARTGPLASGGGPMRTPTTALRLARGLRDSSHGPHRPGERP